MSHWEDLPTAARAAVQAQIAQAIKAETMSHSPDGVVVALLHGGQGLDVEDRVVLKAVPTSHPDFARYETERVVGLSLTDAAYGGKVPAPAMWWADVVDGWLLMLSEIEDDSRELDLSPSSPDLPALVRLLANLAQQLTPCPIPHPLPIRDNLARLQETARIVLGQDPAVLRLDDVGLYRGVLEEFDPDELDGDTLIHFGLSSAAPRVSGNGKAVAVDWGRACKGAAWVDAAMLLPRLIQAGHSPADAETLVAAAGLALGDIPAVTPLAVLYTLDREHAALHGPDPQHAANEAAAGRAWALHRLGR